MPTLGIVICIVAVMPSGSGVDTSQQSRKLAEEATTYLAESDYPSFVQMVRNWQMLPDNDRILLLQALEKRVKDTDKVGVKNPQDLIVPYRWKTGDLKPHAEGHVINQDVYIVGGKATWAIEQLVGTHLPEVNEGLTDKERTMRMQEIRRYVSLYKTIPMFLSGTDYHSLVKVIQEWRTLPATDRTRLVELLAAHLEKIDKSILKNNDELMITYRQKTGDQKRIEFKKYTKQDVYIVGGKAAWAIEELIGVRLPDINEGQSERERAEQALLISHTCIPIYKAGVKDGSASAAPPKK